MLPSATIGIDIGTSCGWAVLGQNGARFGSGTWRLGKGRTRWANMRRQIDGLLGGELFDASCDDIVICYESVEWASTTYAAHVYGGLKALLELATLDHCVRCTSLGIGQWKKIACGNGNADKPAYVAAANQRYGLALTEKTNEDEAAALGIAYACLRELGGPDMPVAGQQGVLIDG